MDLGEPYYIFDIFADEQENIDKRKKKAAERGRTWKEWREDGAAYQVYEEVHGGEGEAEDECLEISVVGDQLGWSTSPQVPGLSSEQASARGRKEGKEAYHEILPCKESIAHHKASPIADAQV